MIKIFRRIQGPRDKPRLMYKRRKRERQWIESSGLDSQRWHPHTYQNKEGRRRKRENQNLRNTIT